MQKFSLLVLTLLFSSVSIIHAQNTTNMFRGTATHVPVKENIQNDCFDQLSWKFNAGATIRSTPVTDNKNIYIGSEKGAFFCVDQSTGKMNWKFNAAIPFIHLL